VVERRTRETEVRVRLCLDGEGRGDISTGIGFFDHLLEALACHGSMDLVVRAVGDLHVDLHHTVEDVGICLGEALRRALGEARGIRRFASAHVPMDDALVLVAVDFGGRPYVDCRFTSKGTAGGFPLALVPEFMRAVAWKAAMNIHLEELRGRDVHHVAEASFKALGVALRDAARADGRALPSTKGVL